MKLQLFSPFVSGRTTQADNEFVKSLYQKQQEAPSVSVSPPGPAHADQAEHHAGQTGSEVRGPPPLWPGRLSQHRPDSAAHAAGRVPAARQRTHARRPAALRAQLCPRGRGPAAAEPPQQGLDPETETCRILGLK